MTIRVAVDMEQVLADVHAEALRRWNDEQGTDYGPESFTDWVLEDSEHGMTFEEFDRLSDEAWRDSLTDPSVIRPMNAPGDAEALARLSRHPRFHVDIVTARQHRETEMEMWLDYHDIGPYGRLVSCPPSFGKWRFGYDLYVDDNPTMEHVSIQYVVAAPYNTHRSGDYGVEYVQTAEEALNAIRETYGDTRAPWWERPDEPPHDALPDPDVIEAIRRYHEERTG